MQQRRGWAYTLAAAVLKPTLLLTTRRDWRHGERLPATGGFVIAMNHLSHIDPLTAAHIVYDHGRLPRYLAKAGLFANPVLGYFMRAAGQIPVERRAGAGAGAYAAAVAAVRAGECVVVYPEGTITRDPDQWPMTGKTGAARIALETGCPVLPVGQWGAQQILPAYTKRPHLWPRATIHMSVGEPVRLDDLAQRWRTDPHDHALVEEATNRIMDAITTQVEAIRGERAPAERYDMSISGDRYHPERDGRPRRDRPDRQSSHGDGHHDDGHHEDGHHDERRAG